MNTMLSKYILLLNFIFLTSLTVKSQAPEWQPPTGLQFSMTVTGILVKPGGEPTSQNDLIGAFQGEEIRGVSELFYEPARDQHYFFLTIFSDQVSGESISFRYFDANGNEIISTPQSVVFNNNEAVGSLAQPFQLKNNNDPSDIEISVSQVSEDLPVDELVLRFSTADADVDDHHIYSLVTGDGDNDNTSFRIKGDSLILNQSLDFETSKNLSVRVRSTDSFSDFREESFELFVTDANDQPAMLTLDNQSIEENSNIGIVVGKLNSTDDDTDDEPTYELVAGLGSDDNGTFMINGSDLILDGAVDFESKSLLSVRVRVTDQEGLFTESAFSLTVTDLDEPSSEINLSENVIEENRSLGTVVGQLSTNDPDGDESFTYELVAGNGSEDNDRFRIVNDQLITDAIFDYEDRSVFSVRVRSVSSKGFTLESAVNLQIENINEAPTLVSLEQNTIAEGALAGALVGVLSADDPDFNELFIYEFAEGQGSEDNEFFRIEGDQLLTNEVFDFEENAMFSIRLKASDREGLFFEKQLDVIVENINEPPVSISLSAFSIAENLDAGTLVGVLTTTDPDSEENFKYEIISDSESEDGSSFIIRGNELLSLRTFDFEEFSSISVIIKSIDIEGLSVESQFDIEITDEIETITSNITLTKKAILAYPNPAVDVLHIDAVGFGKSAYTIVSLTGAIVASGEFEDREILNVENLKSGYYLVKLQTDEGSYVEKILKN